ncbi:FkbM family methyltransferase [Mesorhizobium sp. CGMCC 1.15528]|uniref:FkbM family methyltransferase n=1 Tax=Mesorhizobium zhangyense TaxID=1776730 RepID=A0A7C9VGS4_9HYPH|nr:FkbM family methyltransferase [Mesorhizobium zhangyense]NGN44171.1 FkbM family methyltransferase [Mesorhizobium zhangyense]
MSEYERLVRYYGENAEDCLLWHLFEDRSTGFYVDVGAFDGVYLSNTFSFEQQGWRGICVEPHPEYSRICEKNRPLARTLQLACVDDENLREVPFYTEEIGVYSRLELEEGDVKQLKASYKKHDLKVEGFDRTVVAARTLSSIISEYAPKEVIDFISIDVEGGEIRVLNGLGLDKIRPRALVIEANNAEQAEHLDSYMDSFGYKLGRKIAQNRIFVAAEEDAKKLQSYQMQCFVEKQTHPKGAQYSFPGIVRGKIIDEIRDQKLHKAFLDIGRIRAKADVKEKEATHLTGTLAAARERAAAVEKALKETRKENVASERALKVLRARATELEEILKKVRAQRTTAQRTSELLRQRGTDLTRALERARQHTTLLDQKDAEIGQKNIEIARKSAEAKRYRVRQRQLDLELARARATAALLVKRDAEIERRRYRQQELDARVHQLQNSFRAILGSLWRRMTRGTPKGGGDG